MIFLIISFIQFLFPVIKLLLTNYPVHKKKKRKLKNNHFSSGHSAINCSWISLCVEKFGAPAFLISL